MVCCIHARDVSRELHDSWLGTIALRLKLPTQSLAEVETRSYRILSVSSVRRCMPRMDVRSTPQMKAPIGEALI